MLLVLALVPAVQLHVQALARWTSLATFGVVLVKLFDEPGANAATEPRFGLLIALLAAGVLVASAMTVAAAPTRRTQTTDASTPTYERRAARRPRQLPAIIRTCLASPTPCRA